MKFFTIFLLLTACCFGSGARPTIKFKQMTVDFGNVQVGQVVEVKFEFENIGDQKLVIEDVRTSCGCTTTALTKKEYDPGEGGTIPVRFNSANYSGRVTKTVTIRCNDPVLPNVMLTLVGDVVDMNSAQAQLSTEQINFGKVKIGKTYTQTFSISNAGTADLKINEVQHWPDFFLEFPKKTIPPKKSIEVKLTFTPLDEKAQVTLIKIVTNDKKSSYQLIKAEWQVILPER